MVKNANETAQKVMDKAHNDVVEINDEYERVKQEFIKFRAKYRNFMNTQLETFDDLEKDFIKNYNVSEPVGDDEVTEKEADTLENTAAEEVAAAKEEAKSEIDDLQEIRSFFVDK